VKKPVLPVVKKPPTMYTGPPPIRKQHSLPSRPPRSPEIPFSVNYQVASRLEGPPRQAEVAPLRIVTVKRPRFGREDESDEEGYIFGDGSDETCRSDLEDGEVSGTEQKGDRWAAVAGKKKYQDLKFKKMKL